MAEVFHRHGQDVQITLPQEQRHVYNEFAPPRTNRPFRKRKISTFNFILFLFLLAILSVFYIGNIIAVNQLAIEIEELKAYYSKTEGVNEILRSEVNRKSSMERITKIATEQIGMVYPKQPPIWFEIDEEKLEELQKH